MEQENTNSAQAENKKVCLFKRAKRPNVRQVQKSSSSENDSGTDSDDSTDKKSVSKTAIYKREKQTKRGLSQRSNITTKKLKKSHTGGQSDSSSSSESDDDNRVKHSVSYKGTGEEKSGPSDAGATAVNEGRKSKIRPRYALLRGPGNTP